MKDDWLPCGFATLIVGFNMIIGGWSIDYLLQFFLEKDIPFIGDALIGLFLGLLTVPVAIVVAALQFFGVL